MATRDTHYTSLNPNPNPNRHRVQDPVDTKPQTEQSEQGNVEINARPTQNDVAWTKVKAAKTLNIVDLWDPIDEEEAPQPRGMKARKFEKYPEDPLYGIDWTRGEDPAFLRQQLTSMAHKFTQCRSELEEVENEALEHQWNRGRTQKKNERLQSFAHHVVNTVALPITKNQAARDAYLQRRDRRLTKRENEVKKDKVVTQTELDNYVGAVQRMCAKAKETTTNLERLRDEVFAEDAKLSSLRQDIRAEHEEGMFKERAAWEDVKSKRDVAFSMKRRELDDEYDVSKKEKDILISENIKKEWQALGHSMGLAEGKRITAVDQYNRGYFFGSRNANKKTARQNLDEAFARGKREGEAATTKTYDKFIDGLVKDAGDRMSELSAQCYTDGVKEAGERLGTFLQQRESAVRRNSRAYGLYEGAVTQIRRQNNAEGSEREEEAVATLIAATMADQLVMATDEGNVEKICWHNASNPDSKMFMGSPLLTGSSFYEVLMPKLVEQYEATTERIDTAKREQQEQEKVAADRKDEEWAKQDAAAQEPEQEFVPVESGAPTPYLCRLPPIIEELLETEEAQEMFAQDMVAAYLKGL